MQNLCKGGRSVEEVQVRYRPDPRNRVSQTGARAGAILVGVVPQNEGLRLKVLQDQPRPAEGALKGQFQILDVGDNKHSDSLRELLGATTNAEEVVTIIRRTRPSCVNIVNANILTVEGGA
jgi:hypothetical protein